MAGPSKGLISLFRRLSTRPGRSLLPSTSLQHGNFGTSNALSTYLNTTLITSPYESLRSSLPQMAAVGPSFPARFMATAGHPVEPISQDDASSPRRLKFKRLDKTAKHIMQIIDKEAVEEVKVQREIPDIRPGYIVQLKVEVPENKRRVSTIEGIVIARRNAGLNSTFRLRRQQAGIGIEHLFPLYSPNIKEIKVLGKKKVRRAKLYYLRDRMNALKKL